LNVKAFLILPSFPPQDVRELISLRLTFFLNKLLKPNLSLPNGWYEPQGARSRWRDLLFELPASPLPTGAVKKGLNK